MRKVSQQKHIPRATKGERVLWSGVSVGTREGCVGLHTQLKGYATPLPARCATFYQIQTSNGREMHTSNAVPMIHALVNVLIW